MHIHTSSGDRERTDSTRVLRWAARLLSLLSIGILLLFLAGEGFDASRVAPREWVGLLCPNPRRLRKRENSTAVDLTPPGAPCYFLPWCST